MVALLSGLAGCYGNLPGDLGATQVGDVSNPEATRAPPDAEVRSACGDGVGSTGADTTGADTTIVRSPYLQRVTDREARVLWTTTASAPSLVDVTLPDGAAVTTVPAVVDETAQPADGAEQRRAVITGLAPDTLYCYAIRDGEQGAPPTASRSGFRTAPAAGSGAPVAFVVFGDSGSGNEDQAAVADQLATVPFQLMLHTGDIAYTKGKLAEFETNFFAPYANLLRSLPMFPASGNHEYETNDAAPFREVFDLPNGERWYSYDWGDVHFVALDTEQMGTAQAEWLEADLAANTRPWTVVYGHRPPFSSGEHGSSDDFQQWFVPILERHQVDLVLSGHDHDYERMTPQNGVHYVVTGGGGIGTRSVGSSAFTAFSEAVLHFVFVTIEGDTLRLHAIDATGAEFDSLVIQQH